MITDPHNSEMIYFTVKTIIIGNGLKQAKEVHVIAWYFEKIKFSTSFGDIRPHFSFVPRWCLTWTYSMSSQEKKLFAALVTMFFCCIALKEF